jgi:hypothetical protein
MVVPNSPRRGQFRASFTCLQCDAACIGPLKRLHHVQGWRAAEGGPLRRERSGFDCLAVAIRSQPSILAMVPSPNLTLGAADGLAGRRSIGAPMGVGQICIGLYK